MDTNLGDCAGIFRKMKTTLVYVKTRTDLSLVCISEDFRLDLID